MKPKLTWQRLGIILALGTSLWGTIISDTQAVQLADNTVAFAKSPQLLDAMTTFRAVRARGAKYYFTLFLPPTVDEPLQKITVNLRQGADKIDYQLDKTSAAIGTVRNRTEKIPIADTTFDEETQTVTVTFAKPVSAGTTFTVGLKPKHNPDFGGVYLFGVTAFPAGEKSQGMYLGSVRLDFDTSSDYDFGEF